MGVTTALLLSKLGYKVTVFEKQNIRLLSLPMQMEASNAEVWSHFGTILKAAKWLLRKDAPLKINFWPDKHKASWLTDFLLQIPNYEKILLLLQGWLVSRASICKK
mgnify:CR=1 FL=1